MPAETEARPRDVAIDVLRGLAIALMVVDHTRVFWSGFAMHPTDINSTTPALFFTRWITHFCAPVFVFLAGTGAYFYGSKRGIVALRKFLWTRGIWLVLLELTVVKFPWIPKIGFQFIFLQVIWVLGCGMLFLAVLISWRAEIVAAVGAVIVVLHHVLDGIHIDALWWGVLHEQGTYQWGSSTVFMRYPLLPWIGVIALGYAFGRVWMLDPKRRRKIALRIGLGAIAAFVVIRFWGEYGNSKPWAFRPDGMEMFMSFFNCEKYPPSLAYLLMTLGPSLLLLAALSAKSDNLLIRLLATFGRVPLFVYVAHLYVLRFSAAPFAVARHGARARLPPPDGTAGSPEYPLYVSWIVALVVIVALYPLGRWFDRLKRRRRDLWWLSYL